jgi:DNA polymerase-3 subunit delta'
LAAALLCPDGGCGHCNTCRRALAGLHPDLIVVERTGAAVDVEEARSIVTRAQRRPMEASRQVLVVTDLHLADRAVPALLKTIEEPPPGTVFILLADDLPPALATIASRCVQIPFDRVPDDAVVDWLVARGIEPSHAESVARASGGRLDRALLLVSDPDFVVRRERWRSLPSRLDGTGAVAAEVSDELLASVDAGLAPLRELHREEMATLTEQAELTGAKAIQGRKQIEDRHKREERRWRTEDLRFGFALLAEMFRDRLVAVTESGPAADTHGGAGESRRAVRQIEAIDRASEALGRNASEPLLMDALMVELSGMAD